MRTHLVHAKLSKDVYSTEAIFDIRDWFCGVAVLLD